MSLKVRVGKKYAVYLPKQVVERLGIEEGDILILKVEEGSLILKRVERLPKEIEYWSEVSPEEVEEVGEEISEKMFE
ncbi:MAG: AbrB family transcriptional regulator [Thermoprotei archaeon]|nr:MAG: AbrB family transcriptional regulator [Thermoprotei archaeon]RLF01239.1 MAG: AbrB family transcriptional regulator [Thermoprotei archaeon]